MSKSDPSCKHCIKKDLIYVFEDDINYTPTGTCVYCKTETSHISIKCCSMCAIQFTRCSFCAQDLNHRNLKHSIN